MSPSAEKRIGEIAEREGPDCRCHEGYTSRKLIDPTCPRHDALELIENAIRAALTDPAIRQEIENEALEKVIPILKAVTASAIVFLHGESDEELPQEFMDFVKECIDDPTFDEEITLHDSIAAAIRAMKR